jgi:hypothetical protein
MQEPILLAAAVGHTRSCGARIMQEPILLSAAVLFQTCSHTLHLVLRVSFCWSEEMSEAWLARMQWARRQTSLYEAAPLAAAWLVMSASGSVYLVSAYSEKLGVILDLVSGTFTFVLRSYRMIRFNLRVH